MVLILDFFFVYCGIVVVLGLLFNSLLKIFEYPKSSIVKETRARDYMLKKHFYKWKSFNQANKSLRCIEALRKIEKLYLRRIFKKFYRNHFIVNEMKMKSRIKNLESEVLNLTKKLLASERKTKTLDDTSISEDSMEPFSYFPKDTFVSPAYKKKLDEKLPPFYLRAPSCSLTFDGEIFTPSSVSPTSMRSSISSPADPVTTDNRPHVPNPIGPRKSRSVSCSSLFAQPHLEVDRHFDVSHYMNDNVLESLFSEEQQYISTYEPPKMNPFAPAWTPSTAGCVSVPSTVTVKVNSMGKTDEEIMEIKKACRAELLCYHFHLHGRCVRGVNCKFAHEVIDSYMLLQRHKDSSQHGKFNCTNPKTATSTAKK